MFCKSTASRPRIKAVPMDLAVDLATAIFLEMTELGRNSYENIENYMAYVQHEDDSFPRRK